MASVLSDHLVLSDEPLQTFGERTPIYDHGRGLVPGVLNVAQDPLQPDRRSGPGCFSAKSRAGKEFLS